MADGRRNNGGNKNAGRKPKADEQKLIEKLTPLAEKAYSVLEKALEEKKQWAVKMFFEYYYGKPKQYTDITSNGNSIDIPTINFTKGAK